MLQAAEAAIAVPPPMSFHRCTARAMILLFLSTATVAKVKLIIDTDIGGGGCRDVDDVAAICIANALVDRGEVELLAIVQNTQPLKCAGVISVLNHYYGHDDVPIGAYTGSGLDPASAVLPFVPDLAEHWPSPIKNTSQALSAVKLYRSVLSSQPDDSVVISSIGLLTNLESLLRSTPDAIRACRQKPPRHTLSGLALRALSTIGLAGARWPRNLGPHSRRLWYPNRRSTVL